MAFIHQGKMANNTQSKGNYKKCNYGKRIMITEPGFKTRQFFTKQAIFLRT